MPKSFMLSSIATTSIFTDFEYNILLHFHYKIIMSLIYKICSNLFENYLLIRRQTYLLTMPVILMVESCILSPKMFVGYNVEVYSSQNSSTFLQVVLLDSWLVHSLLILLRYWTSLHLFWSFLLSSFVFLTFSPFCYLRSQ